ncbi:MAG: DUF1570 domain-containing protein [Planctomycetes bacterium]|nr:DUF1570 domain-containing protein [Planctomycetota bacterium]
MKRCAVQSVLLAAMVAAWPAIASEPSPPTDATVTVSPKRFGLDVAPGAVSAGRDRRVLTADEDGGAVVARVHVQVGPTLIVMLPDGRLVARGEEQCSPTERPFEAIGMDQLAQRLGDGEFAGWRTRHTRRYLYVYNCSDTFIEVASRVLETMFRGIGFYAQAQKIEVAAPEFPLVVVVFGTQKEFKKYQQMTDGVVAYYDLLTNRVLMCEESDLWEVKQELAIRQSIATIAHEGAHQVLHNIGVQQRLSLWPMWLNEGLAEFFAPTSTDRRLKWKGVGEVNDLRMFELEQLIKSRAPDKADGQLVAQTVGAARLTSTGYAMAWALTHYLADRQRESLAEFVRAMSHRGPLCGGGEVVSPGVIPGNLRDFKQYFGEDLADIERRVMLHLCRLPYQDPFADWPHFVAFVQLPNGGNPRRQAEVFHLPLQAKRWCDALLATLPAEQRELAKSEVREFSNRAEAEQTAHRWLQGP